VWKIAIILAVIAAIIFLPAYTLLGAPAGTGGSGGGSNVQIAGDSPRKPPSNVAVDYNRTGIFFPLFAPPGKMWDDMLEYRSQHPSLPWVSVINPDSGPGTRVNDLYLDSISELRDYKVSVLGYVSTFWAGVPIEDAKADIERYKEFYDLDGIFLDEMSNQKQYVPYYQELTDYAKSLGMDYVIGNTGTDAAPEYVGVVDNIVISEGYGVPSLSRLGGWHVEHSRDNFSYIAHSQNTIDRSYVLTSADFASYVFFTDDYMPNPYDKFPSHFDELLAILDPGNPGHFHNVVVKSVSTTGAPVNGTLTLSHQRDTVATSKGWATFVGTAGDSYVATALNNRDYVFEHWEDGSRERTRDVQLQNSTRILTAYYRDRTDADPPGLTINAITEKGAELSMAVVIESNGERVDNGFTPFRFEGEPGEKYTVYVAEWSNFVFDRWAGDRSSNNWQEVILTGEEQILTAYYEYETPAAAMHTLTVNAYDSDGGIATMWTTIRQGDETHTGYTPMTIPVKRGDEYSVSVADWEDQVFDHWKDGSESRTTEIEIKKQHEEVIAYYAER
jgi:hypothetical protein